MANSSRLTWTSSFTIGSPRTLRSLRVSNRLEVPPSGGRDPAITPPKGGTPKHASWSLNPKIDHISHLSFSVTAESAGERLDSFLAARVEGWSRARLHRLIE